MVADLNTKYKKLKKQFEKFHQDHVFRFWDELSSIQKEELSNQIESIDLQLVDRLANEFVINPHSSQSQTRELIPAEVIPIPKTQDQIKKAEEAKRIGEEIVKAGKVGIILVAGGQGTRLGFSGPKGKFPITPVRKKSLFQFHAEKIIALSRKYQTKLPWYIMTSDINDSETKEFFRANGHFGLDSADVYFFQQQMIPAVDENGKLFLENQGKVFTNPNGHGGTLQALLKSGALIDMVNRGIEELFYFQIDNVLINICDPIFVGYHVQAIAEMSSKVLSKRDPYEKVGVVGYLNGKLTVVEYSDLTEDEMVATDPDGKLKFNAGSIAIHMINRKFIEDLTDGNLALPYHLAHKKIPYVDQSGKMISPSEPNGYKFETFIFEALQFTQNSIVMEVEREKEFSPVKNVEGVDSAQTAEQDLCNIYGTWLENGGIKVDRNGQNSDVKGKVEISPLFALDQKEFLEKAPKNLEFIDGLYLD